jgi:hypothetical protein
MFVQLRERLQRIVERDDVQIALRGYFERFIEDDGNFATPALLRLAHAGMVNEDALHELCGDADNSLVTYRLCSGATLVDTTVTDLTETLERRSEARSVAPVHFATTDDSPPPPELQAIETEFARRHWDAWLDTKVPARLRGVFGVLELWRL